MALVTAIVNAAGKTIYRQAGRFISKSTFEREARRIPAGFKRGGQLLRKFSAEENSIAQRLLAEMGPPIGDGDWVSRVRQSTERFAEMAAQNNQLG